MARKNIFELLDSRWDREEELDRLNRLFDDVTVVNAYKESYTLKEFVEEYCFGDWKNRGRFIDLDDFLETLDFDGLSVRASNYTEDFLTYIEILYNLFYMANSEIVKSEAYLTYECLIILKDNLDECLSRYNYEVLYSEEKEQAIVYEKDPAVTAAAEISDSETAFQIIQYNHHSLKGDIAAKKSILLHLASDLEPKRSTLSGINSALSDDIFMLLNNMNLRHNNCDSQSKDYKQYVDEMIEEALETWYDELYQMILLAKLELDHLERKAKIAELKSHI